MAVRITTLGTLRIEQGGHVLDRLPAARNRCALLVHIALEREVARDQAMALLWPERPQERARHLLSQTLYELRQELGEEWVEAVGEQLRATPELGADARDMEQAVEAGDFDRAVSLYTGPFLPGSPLSVSRPMEGWVEAQRSRLVRLHRKARRGAIDVRAERGQLTEALGFARGWVELDPLDDEAQHRLIELLGATGDRSGALRQYDRYASLVESELELEPLEETRDLVERIRDGAVGGRPAPRVSEPATAYAAGVGPAAEAEPTAVPEAADEELDAPARVDILLDKIAALRHRRSVRWTLAYLAFSVVVLEGTDVVSGAFGWPPQVLRALALALAIGAIGVLGTAWYTGERERVFGKTEAALTLLVASFVLTLPAWFSRAGPTVAAEGERLAPNRLAVLYFDDLSPDQSLGSLAGGFTEALIHELSQVEGLDVVSRRAVAPFRENQELPYDSLVSMLGAGTLVEGSLTRIGDKVRLTIQLIDGETSAHLMSTTLESAADSVDQLLVAMPGEAARLLRQELGDWVHLQEMETAATSVRALELVQRARPMIEDARAVRWSDTVAALPLLNRADSMLTEAERLDPEWPEPTMMRAEVAAVRALTVAEIPTHYHPDPTRTAFAHLNRVLDQWPDYAPALAMRGNLRYELAESGSTPTSDRERLFDQAKADLRKAVLEDDDLSSAWWALSKVLMHEFSYAEAHQAALRARESDAFLTAGVENLYHLWDVTFNAEDHPGAMHWCDELGRRYPNSASYQYCQLYLLTSSPLVTPDVERAWEIADAIADAAPADQEETYRQAMALQVAKVIVRSGMPDSARAVLRTRVPQPVPDWATYDAAHLHLMLGDEDQALDLLQRWFDFNPVRARRLARDWWFSRLRGQPRFDQLVGRVDG